MKNLLALTVAGTSKWLRYALQSFREEGDWQILVISDGKSKEVKSLCEGINKGIKVVEKEETKGLTDSWNMMCRFFRAENFDNCILSNDDVRFPKGFSGGLISGLNDYILMGPLSNQPGDGEWQQIAKYYPGNVNEIDKVQEGLRKVYIENPCQEVSYLNGFCFAFNRKIFNYAFDKDNVFNPVNINVGQEIDLIGRIRVKGGKLALCKTSYVYHIKARTLKGVGIERNRLWNQ